MGESHKEKVKRLQEIIGRIAKEEHGKKAVNIIKDEKQYRISIPMLFAETLKLDPEKDHFEFHLIPKGEKQGFELTAKLIRK